ncbi:MAG: phosphatase PAP2 family protein [Mycobacteriales bacterium]
MVAERGTVAPALPGPAAPESPVKARFGRPSWWLEIGYLVVGYAVYAAIRDLHGRLTGVRQTAKAYADGRAVWHVERVLHIDIERAVQDFFLRHHTVLRVLGGFYGSAHFVLTGAVLVWLLLRRPELYRFWRTVLAVTTAVALAVFALFPTAPPRLLPGGLVDTLARVGGLWSYNHGVVEHISDPYAAMPSLHLAWASWTVAALWVALPATRWIRLLLAGYLTLVLVTVLATGAHYLLDTVAGVAPLAAVLWAVRAWWPRWEAFQALRS